MEISRNFAAFLGERCVGQGELQSVIRLVKRCIDTGETNPILIFDDSTGQQIDFDFQGTVDEVVERLASHPICESSEAAQGRAGPGRPRLGVVSREVSLLPRHWQWLEQQPQGISASIRRLIDEARKRDPEGERTRRARDATAKFMWAMAGNLPRFEEASRALFAGDRHAFDEHICGWPKDIRDHLRQLLLADA